MQTCRVTLNDIQVSSVFLETFLTARIEDAMRWIFNIVRDVCNSSITFCRSQPKGTCRVTRLCGILKIIVYINESACAQMCM